MSAAPRTALLKHGGNKFRNNRAISNIPPFAFMR
jgi:hypothetical protein